MSHRVLVIGASGLLGNAVFRVLAEGRVDTIGVLRNPALIRAFSPSLESRLHLVCSVENMAELAAIMDKCRPTVVVNCAAAGRPAPADPMRSIAIYATFPRRLAVLCRERGARLVQISSDGVFSGRRGGYSECDMPDADDLYGVSKLLGEIDDGHAITLRISVIGHELSGRNGLLEWFLSQEGHCRCHRRAVFSGLSSIEIATVIRDFVLPRDDLSGIFHLAGSPISKYVLLRNLAAGYDKTIELVPDDDVQIDRSLDGSRFAAATGYTPPSWPAMIDAMQRHNFGLEAGI